MKKAFNKTLLKNYQSEIDVFLAAYDSVHDLSKNQKIELSKNAITAQDRDETEHF